VYAEASALESQPRSFLKPPTNRKAPPFPDAYSTGENVPSSGTGVNGADSVGKENVGRGRGVGVQLAAARAVSVPATHGVGLAEATAIAVSVPAIQGVGVKEARAVSVPPT
jgi:hypothetical protein